jgi:hypothetical protein
MKQAIMNLAWSAKEVAGGWGCRWSTSRLTGSVGADRHDNMNRLDILTCGDKT